MLNERLARAVEMLGSDKPPATRQAAVYAMAGLTDEWEQNRQNCVNVLCDSLRMPYKADQASQEEQLAYRASRDLRHTVIRVITAHLKRDAKHPWRDVDFDFTGVLFDGGDFSYAEFSGGHVTFKDAKFSGDVVDFTGAKISDCQVDFRDAEFSSGQASFRLVKFYSGQVDFTGAKFSGGNVYFNGAEFTGSQVSFNGAKFSGGQVSFKEAKFSGTEVAFYHAEFSGSNVPFTNAEFYHGNVDFSQVASWTSKPEFPWGKGTPPLWVKLPR